MNEAQERYEFEQLIRKHYPHGMTVVMVQRGDGEYLNPDVRLAWWAWQKRAEFDNIRVMAIQPRLDELQRISENLAGIVTKFLQKPGPKSDS